jgi:hypothetical protein
VGPHVRTQGETPSADGVKLFETGLCAGADPAEVT